MPITTVDVDSIVSDQELDEFLGGQVKTGATGLAPETWQNAAKPARQYALDRVLEALRRRTPPITYGDLQAPQELRLAILYGAAEHLYQLAMSSSGAADVFEKQRELWEKKFDGEISGLTPTLSGGYRGSSRSFGVSRR